jgi:hypothetical protein
MLQRDSKENPQEFSAVPPLEAIPRKVLQIQRIRLGNLCKSSYKQGFAQSISVLWKISHRFAPNIEYSAKNLLP